MLEGWYLLAIDSGSPDIGLAVYEIGGTLSPNLTGGAVLRHAAHVQVERPEDKACPACKFSPCRHGVEPELVELLCDAAEAQLERWGFTSEKGMPRAVIAEQPQSFRGSERGDRSILLCLAVMAALLDRARCWTKQVYQYTPAVWKGNTPKDQHQRLALSRLSEEERALLPRSKIKQYYVSDALDAASLGLWFLERIGARREFFHCLPAVFEGQVEPLQKKRKVAPGLARMRKR